MTDGPGTDSTDAQAGPAALRPRASSLFGRMFPRSTAVPAATEQTGPGAAAGERAGRVVARDRYGPAEQRTALTRALDWLPLLLILAISVVRQGTTGLLGAADTLHPARRNEVA